MSINMKVLAIGSAGVVALAGAGLYAGSLAVSTSSNTFGAGDTFINASCTDAAVVTPAKAVWNSSLKKFTYATATVTGDFSACEDETATLNVFNTGTGTASNTGTHVITSGEAIALGSFTVTFTTPAEAVDAGLPADTTKYGLLIQDRA